MRIDSNVLIIICMVCAGVGLLVGFIAATFGFKRGIDKVKRQLPPAEAGGLNSRF